MYLDTEASTKITKVLWHVSLKPVGHSVGVGGRSPIGIRQSCRRGINPRTIVFIVKGSGFHTFIPHSSMGGEQEKLIHSSPMVQLFSWWTQSLSLIWVSTLCQALCNVHKRHVVHALWKSAPNLAPLLHVLSSIHLDPEFKSTNLDYYHSGCLSGVEMF